MEHVDVRSLPLSLIDARPGQPRRAPRARALQELVRSIAEVGVREPVVVRRRGERYELVAGERRCIAARMVGLVEIPAHVLDDGAPHAHSLDAEARLAETLVAQVHRADVSLSDRAAAIRHARSGLGLSTWQAVAERLGVSRGHLHRLLAVSGLPAGMRDDPRIASLTEKHVRALRRLDARPLAQLALWERIHREAVSGEQALAIAAGRVGSSRGDDHERAVVAVRRAALALLDGLADLEKDGLERVRSDLEHLHTTLARLLAAG